MTDSAAAASTDSGDIGSPSSFRAAMASQDSTPEPDFGADDIAPNPAAQIKQAVKNAKQPAAKAQPGKQRSASQDFVAQRAARQLKQAIAKEREIHGEEAPEPELEQEEEDNSAEFEPEYEEAQPDEQPEQEEETEQPDQEQPQEVDGEEQPQDPNEPTLEQTRALWDALSSTHLPEELQDRLIRCTDGEREYDVPIAEMRNGFMRQDRFTRKMQEVTTREEQAAAREQHALQTVDNIRQQFAVWKQNPEAFVNDMIHMVGRQTLEKATEQYATYLFKIKNMDPEKRTLFLELEARKEQEHRAQMEARRAEQMQRAQQQQPQQDPNLPGVTRFLEASVPSLFERHGIALNNPSIARFSEHMRYAWDGRQETVTQAMDAAAQATLFELRQQAQEYWEQQTQPQKQQGVQTRQAGMQKQRAQQLKQATSRFPQAQQRRPQLGPRATPGPARKAVDRNRRGTAEVGGSPSDFRKLMGSNGR